MSDGISNAMNEVAAAQADKVRDCLAPVRRNLLRAMDQQMGAEQIFSQSKVQILSPFEERVMKALAEHVGADGKTGQNIPKSLVLEKANLSDIRFRSVIRMLKLKLLAVDHSYSQIVGSGKDMRLDTMDVVSLWDAGEEYVLEMGYTR